MALYFVYVPIILSLLIYITKLLFRKKMHHPQGNNLTDEQFKKIENARNISLGITLLFISSILICYELYIEGIQDIKFHDNKYMFELTGIVSGSLFLSISILLVQFQKQFKKYLSLRLEELIRDEQMIEQLRESRRITLLRNAMQGRDENGQKIVEYLEDSRASVEYFQKKNSMVYSIAEGSIGSKGSKPLNLQQAGRKFEEENVRFFNLQSINQEGGFLNTVSVDCY